jgi:hypothetical protein
MMARRNRALADRRPNAPRYRLQAEPMFVARKDFDRPLGMLFRFLGDDVFEVFFDLAP